MYFNVRRANTGAKHCLSEHNAKLCTNQITHRKVKTAMANSRRQNATVLVD
jgi:hypothetical protein